MIYRTYTFWSLIVFAVACVCQFIPGLNFILLMIGVPVLITLLFFLIPFVIVPLEIRKQRISPNFWYFTFVMLIFYMLLCASFYFLKYQQHQQIADLTPRMNPEEIIKFDPEKHVLKVPFNKVYEFLYKKDIPLVLTELEFGHNPFSLLDKDETKYLSRRFGLKERDLIYIAKLKEQECALYQFYVPFESGELTTDCVAYFPFSLVETRKAALSFNHRFNYNYEFNYQNLWIQTHYTDYQLDDEIIATQTHVQVEPLPPLPIPVFYCAAYIESANCEFGFWRSTRRILNYEKPHYQFERAIERITYQKLGVDKLLFNRQDYLESFLSENLSLQSESD